MSWAHETVRIRPYTSAAVLAAGAVAYWFACQRAIYARGYPPIDPFWQAMPWLCVFPIFVSAIYDNDRKRRIWELIAYSIVVGFVLGGVLAAKATPRFVSIHDMALGIVFYSPFVFALSWVLERLTQRALGLIRQFELSDRCAKCGYCIRHLDKPRCPECGEPFDEKWLDESFQPPRAAKHPWRTRIVAGLLIAAGVGAPFAYHGYALSGAAARGRADAESDWERGEALLYVQLGDRFVLSYDTYDIDTGLLMRRARGGLENETYAQAYQHVIDGKLAQFGPPPKPQGLLTREDVKTLLASNRLVILTEFPFRLTDQVTVSQDASYTTVSRRYRNGGSSSFAIGGTKNAPVRYANLAEHADAIVLLVGDMLMTFAPDGRLLQHHYVEDAEVADPMP